MENFFERGGNEKFENSMAGLDAEIGDLADQIRYLEAKAANEGDKFVKEKLEKDLESKKASAEELIREMKIRSDSVQQGIDERKKGAGHA